MTFQSNVLSALVDDEGMWRDPEGVHHETAEEYMGHLLGFCGCGNPESALRYVRDALAGIRDCSDAHYSEEAWRKRDAAYASDGERYFVWYRLDALELTEHGGSVPGWLTPKGHDWLLALDEALAGDGNG